MGSSPSTRNAVKPENHLADLEDNCATPRKLKRRTGLTEAGLRDALSYAASIVDTVREPMLVLDGNLCVVTASRAFYQTFGVLPEVTEGQFIYDLGNGQWNIPALRTALEEVLPKEQSFQDFKVVHDFPALGRRVMLLNARKLWREDNNSVLVLLAIEDVTERKRLEDELLRSNEDLQRFAYVAAHDLRSPLNAALNLSELLARRLEGRLDAEEADMQKLAVESMKRLSSLMQDILSYSEFSRHAAPANTRACRGIFADCIGQSSASHQGSRGRYHGRDHAGSDWRPDATSNGVPEPYRQCSQVPARGNAAHSYRSCA